MARSTASRIGKSTSDTSCHLIDGLTADVLRAAKLGGPHTRLQEALKEAGVAQKHRPCSSYTACLARTRGWVTSGRACPSTDSSYVVVDDSRQSRSRLALHCDNNNNMRTEPCTSHFRNYIQGDTASPSTHNNLLSICNTLAFRCVADMHSRGNFEHSPLFFSLG